ncbi:MAG TPA: threonine synthase [Candidatus Avidehalobacter gallistercoris]|uniref:tRNA (guanine-N(7)-)-methyltransferase n=1 Tax=Candidatus Avidehalobacter gallistercoris TaxID=2840694 RepID=A0A9D1KY80_9FIRM|nr:threonine synthase [Candidatus Avidehalobacter gallistercoris]
MRLRHVPGSREKLENAPNMVLKPETAPVGGWQELFAARGSAGDKLCLEIGCGRGRFCNDLARQNPQLNIIGLELHEDVLARALEKLEEEDVALVSNLALLWQDASKIVDSFARGEVNRIYLNFSDPWPKKKHAKRRLTSAGFLAVYAKILAADGELWLKTDNRELFEWSADQLLQAGWRLHDIDYNYPPKAAAEDEITEYESRFRALGQPIFRLCASCPAANTAFEVKSMRYISTRGNTQGVTAAEAIRLGMVPGGGLFVPEQQPRFPYSWAELCAMSYQTLAEKVLGLFLTDYTEDTLHEIVAAAYGDNFADAKIAPLKKLSGGVHILELWHGPTAAFKDMALQILPRLLTEAGRISGEDKEVDILVATSGDTGKAALEGFKNVPGVKIICFYPAGGVSRTQYLQMATTDGDNTYVCAVRGNFDDCQTGVKRIFGDEALAKKLVSAGKCFSSANSINWGRLCPQIVYYFWSYAEMLRQGSVKPGEAFNVAVPTGNFGNILAAYYAREMGLPIKHLVCASNSNRVLADALATGVYDKRREFVKTTSPSMDILISSNFERFYYAMCGGDAEKVRAAYAALDKDGVFTADEDAVQNWRKVISGGYAAEEQVAATIRHYLTEKNYALDPHTAVAAHVYAAYAEQSGDAAPVVIAATASPFKFGRAVLAALGEDIAADAAEDEVLRRLANKIGRPAHRALVGLEQKPVLHNTEVEPADMPKLVADILQL